MAIMYDCPTEYRRHIETFEFKVYARKKTVTYSLPAMDAKTLYKNRHKLPKGWVMAEPYSPPEGSEEALNSTGSSSAGKGKAAIRRKRPKVSSAEKKARTTFPKHWKKDERDLSIKEARERMENPMATTAKVSKVKIGATGKVTITLSGSIRFPSYMKNDPNGTSSPPSRRLANANTMLGYGGGSVEIEKDDGPAPGPGGDEGFGGFGDDSGGKGGGGGEPGGGGGKGGGGKGGGKGKGGGGPGGKGKGGGGKSGGKGGRGGSRGGGRGCRRLKGGGEAGGGGSKGGGSAGGGGKGGGGGGPGGGGPGGAGGQAPCEPEEEEVITEIEEVIEEVEEEIEVEVYVPPTLEELKASCSSLQYWNAIEEDCEDLEFYFGSMLDMVSIKIENEAGG